MDRRSFIKLTAVTGTTATLAACGSPENQLIRFVPEEELPAGMAEWKPSVCPLCAAGCGLTVRVMPADVETTRNGQQGVVRMGVAKKLEGSPEHPVNKGGLCARGQAAIQVTYHPDRITQPLKRNGARGTGAYDLISWDDAIPELVSRLDAVAATSDRRGLAFVTGAPHSHRQALIRRFLNAFGALPFIEFNLFGDDVLRHANSLSFGRAQLPTVDFENARFVLGFGADFLGTWNSPVSQAAGYGDMRQRRRGVRGMFTQVESRMTTTGANADDWIPVVPGTEGVLALGIAHVILAAGSGERGGRAASQIEGWSGGLTAYTPDAVERITGVRGERVERLAHEFLEEAPSVAIVGGPPLAHTNGLFTALAVNALNELVGAPERAGGLLFTPMLRSSEVPSTDRQALSVFAEDVLAGRRSPDVLLVDGANPVFSAPRSWKVREAFDKSPFIVSFASFVDETSAMADLILPDHSFLESWVDATPEAGSRLAVVSVAPPAMRPLYDTRAMPDVLLEAGRRLQRPLNLPWQTFEEMLQATFVPLGEDAWSNAQRQGGWWDWGALPQNAFVMTRIGGDGPAPQGISYTPPTFDGSAESYPFQFLPYPTLQFMDGSTAHLPWLQELPDPTTSGMWSSWVEINPTTAARLGIAQGDIVEVASSVGAVRSPAFINPAIAPDLVAMPVGQGHQTFTRYASGRGQNPVEILAAMKETHTGALAWAATRVQVRRVADPDGSLILFSARGELRERPHEGEMR